MAQYGFTQIIQKLTHLHDYLSSCIDLIFAFAFHSSNFQIRIENTAAYHEQLYSK